MNERIRELAVEAGAEPSGGYVEQSNGDSVYSLNAYVDPRDIDLEKFAELIIQECGNALSPMLRDMISRGQAYELIKKHFGVEE